MAEMKVGGTHLVLGCVMLPIAAMTGCPNPTEGLCGLSSDAVDDVEDGMLDAQKNGDAFNQSATWAPGPNASVDAGVLSLIIPVDETGTAFDDLVSDRAFPFCVPLGTRGDKTGLANYVDGGYVSDDDHSGGVLILDEQDGVLSGRFEVEMVRRDGDTLEFTNGAFRAERR